MCGRFTQYFTWRQLVETYQLTQPALNLEPRYNIAPTTQVLTIRLDPGGRFASLMRWGLVPQWWKDSAKLPSTFNARSDTVAAKPMFRSAYAARRCIVPASGFYEWKSVGKVKRPHFITMASGEPMSFGGLWEPASHASGSQPSCTIITTDANELMAKIHNRMPVILGHGDINAWLTGDAAVAAWLMRPAPAEWLEAREVSTYVSNVRNQGEACIAPLNAAS